jgi:hypothetical protein
LIESKKKNGIKKNRISKISKKLSETSLAGSEWNDINNASLRSFDWDTDVADSLGEIDGLTCRSL